MATTDSTRPADSYTIEYDRPSRKALSSYRGGYYAVSETGSRLTGAFPTEEQARAAAEYRIRRQAEQAVEVEQSATTQVAPVASLATDRQVAYIVKLLVHRLAGGAEGGFSGLVVGLTTGSHVNRPAVEALTRAQASQVIDSLTAQY